MKGTPAHPQVLLNIHVHMYKPNTEMSPHHQSLPATILHRLPFTVATDVTGVDSRWMARCQKSGDLWFYLEVRPEK